MTEAWVEYNTTAICQWPDKIMFYRRWKYAVHYEKGNCDGRDQTVERRRKKTARRYMPPWCIQSLHKTGERRTATTYIREWSSFHTKTMFNVTSSTIKTHTLCMYLHTAKIVLLFWQKISYNKTTFDKNVVFIQQQICIFDMLLLPYVHSSNTYS